MYLIIGLLALTIVVMLIYRGRQSGATGGKNSPNKPVDLLATTAKFHAVSIRTGLIACDAARALYGERFLSDAAPLIPLKGCNVDSCQCKFVHHADRRSGEDRRSPYPSSLTRDTGVFRQEQREASDRRREPPAS
ncbi:MAG: hypothetical protein WDZ50_02185 [Woeseia sp.]